MQEGTSFKIPVDYYILLILCTFMVILAFVFDSPAQVISGFYRITTSRSVLVSDYVALGGVGAALLNAAISGLFYLVLLIILKIPVNGRIILALFLTIGFSLFGKNITNMLPIFLGILLYAIIRKVKFSTLMVQAMVSGTVGPIVSEIAFLNEEVSLVRILIALAVGLFIGFIFPVVMDAVKRMHRGYNLYNGGVAGGFIATFFVGVMNSLGIEVVPENFWDTEHTVFLASFAYILAAALIAFGVITEGFVNGFKKYYLLLKESDVNDNDYLTKYGHTCYINIGVLCIVSTTLMIILQIPINGPVLGGILTVAGFGAAGKHLRNTVPVLLGSTIATHLNYYDVDQASNSLAILFSTGLAPISGKHGWQWGLVTGFVHVSVAIIVGNLNGGMNLYNNGFAGGFVAIMLVPLIIFCKELFGKSDGEKY